MINWKDVAIGSASTPIVTVVAGVVIYYLTKEPPTAPPSEKLVYEVQRSGEFVSAATKLSLQAIRVANLGSAPAANVRAVVEYPEGAKVVDKVASMSSGPVGTFSLSAPNPSTLNLVVNSLTPGETITTSVMLSQGKDNPLPKIGVKSALTVGVEGELVAQRADEKPSEVTRTVGRLIPILFLLQLPLILYFPRRMRRLFRFGYDLSLNNTAFVLLHQGYVEEAFQLLRRAIFRGDADANVFANRALCLALNGDNEGASKSLAAAEFYDKAAADIAVICFNRAMIAAVAGDEAAVKHNLEAAINDHKDAGRWARSSKILDKYAANMRTVKQLIEDV